MIDLIRQTWEEAATHFEPFYVNGYHVGLVSDRVSEVLCANFAEIHRQRGVTEASVISLQCEFCDISETFMRIQDVFISHSICTKPTDELIAVKLCKAPKQHIVVPRSIMIPLGLLMPGVHLNGYSISQGEVKVWLGRRSVMQSSFPGFWDNTAAGMQPHEASDQLAMMQEAWEEAGITSVLFSPAVRRRAYGYRVETPGGLARGVIRIFDCQLPPEFIPQSVDRSVEEHRLLSLPQILEMCDDGAPIKPVSAIAIADWLVHVANVRQCDRMSALGAALETREVSD